MSAWMVEAVRQAKPQMPVTNRPKTTSRMRVEKPGVIKDFAMARLVGTQSIMESKSLGDQL